MTTVIEPHPPMKDAPDLPRLYADAARAIVRVTGLPGSVLDVGSNIGQWARAFATLGCGVLALDAPHMERHVLPGLPFRAVDLCEPFDLGRRFDLCLCLEVGEHLPDASADGLVASLYRHADAIVFSAATPGQPGHGHINCQPFDYWRAKFADAGYAADLMIRLELPIALPGYYRDNMAIFRKGAE